MKVIVLLLLFLCSFGAFCFWQLIFLLQVLLAKSATFAPPNWYDSQLGVSIFLDFETLDTDSAIPFYDASPYYKLPRLELSQDQSWVQIPQCQLYDIARCVIAEFNCKELTNEEKCQNRILSTRFQIVLDVI